MPVTFAGLLEDCAALHTRKDSDYAGSTRYANFRVSERFGMRPDMAVMVRLSDKFQRVTTLLDKEAAGKAPEVAESLDDTLRDLINYAAIMLVLRYEVPSPLGYHKALTFEGVMAEAIRQHDRLYGGSPPAAYQDMYDKHADRFRCYERLALEFAALCEWIKAELRWAMSQGPYPSSTITATEMIFNLIVYAGVMLVVRSWN